MENAERTAEIKRLYTEIHNMQRELGTLVNGCPHHVVCSDCGEQSTSEECPKSTFGHGSARCTVCGKWFGWYCPKSPDHRCYYYTNTSTGTPLIVLENGTLVAPPDPNHDTRNESEDWCLFCGNPDERK